MSEVLVVKLGGTTIADQAQVFSERRADVGQLLERLAFAADNRTLWAASPQGVFSGVAPFTRWASHGLGEQRPYDVVPDPTEPQVVYASGENGVVLTTDAGDHWRLIKIGATGLDGVAISRSNDVAYGWSGTTVFRSADHGATWTRLSALP